MPSRDYKLQILEFRKREFVTGVKVGVSVFRGFAGLATE
jgi:hypothetical protein